MQLKNAEKTWETVLGRLQLQVTRPSFETWLKDTKGLAQDNGTFVVGTPSSFAAEMLEQRMYRMISDTVQHVQERPTEVRFVVLSGESSGNITTADQTTPGPEHAKATTSVNTAGVNGSPTPCSRRQIRLNPRYTFESFIVGKSNELAHAAALAVAGMPGEAYNPLVVYSDVGLGKTHLLHAIGHQILNAGKSVIYSTTEEFTNEYIKAIRDGKTEAFRDFYRSADALLLDDIQFIIGKEQTQEGFFHTFNALHMSNRQVVITSDRPVTALSLLEDRMRSRLAGGLVVDIQSPDLETRLAILTTKAEDMGQRFPAEVLQFISERVHRNIRDLEGTLNRIVAYAQILRTPITIDLVKRSIADVMSPRKTSDLTTDQVITAVSSYFGIEPAALIGRRRDKHTALARQVAMYLLREETGMGLTAIGRAFGGKDHSTVIHNCTRVSKRIDLDAHLRRDVINIREALASRS